MQKVKTPVYHNAKKLDKSVYDNCLLRISMQKKITTSFEKLNFISFLLRVFMRTLRGTFSAWSEVTV